MSVLEDLDELLASWKRLNEATTTVATPVTALLTDLGAYACRVSIKVRGLLRDLDQRNQVLQVMAGLIDEALTQPHRVSGNEWRDAAEQAVERMRKLKR